MQIAEFLIASSILTIMPGPDIIYVLSQSIIKGKRAGISVSMGLCTGIFVHTAAVALGLALIITSSPVLFNIVKYAGIFYMLYMALMSYLNRNKYTVSDADSTDIQNKSFKKLYKTGIMMNLLNPKVILFFLAFLPQFIGNNSENPKSDIFILGSLFALQAIVIFTLVSLSAGFLSEKFSIKNVLERRQGIINAVVYTLIAILFIAST